MTTKYINPALPSMIRGLYKADLREKSIQNMLDLAADLVQELIDIREQADREPSTIRANVRNLTGTTDEELTRLGGFRGEPSDAEVRLEAATWALIERDTDTSDRGVSEEHYRERRAEVELVAALLAAQEVRRG